MILKGNPHKSASAVPLLGCLGARALAGSIFLILGTTGSAAALDLTNDPTLLIGTSSLSDGPFEGAYDQYTYEKYEPNPDEGFRFGNFYAYPTFDAGIVYDDNIFGSHINPVSDTRFELAPLLRIQSDMPRHAINFIAGANSISYADVEDQDYVDLHGLLRGRIDINHAHAISASVGSAILHEEPGAITAPTNIAKPTEFRRNNIALGISRNAGRVYGTLSASVTELDYSEAEAANGTLIDQNFRDTLLYRSQLRAGYRFSPGFEAIGKVAYYRRTDEAVGSRNQDSNGYEAVFGLNMETNPLIQWTFVVGYGIREFDDETKDDVRSLLLKGEVNWDATPRLKLLAAVVRRIDDSIGASDSGRIDTVARVGAKYEIYHNLSGTASLAVGESDFIGSDRADTTYQARLGLEYIVSRHWQLSADYTYQDRQSNNELFDMSRNYFRVGARLKF